MSGKDHTSMDNMTPKDGRSITRRDFLNGTALVIGASMCPFGELFAQDSGPDPSPLEPFLARGITPQDARYYPPGLTGMRGSHPGSFETAHELRDDKRWPAASTGTDTGERYDLVVVGGGISGLAAAYFYRQKNGPNSKILVLDNHDDFGGHAKRNEFHADNRLLLGYGGTQSIEAPGRYSQEAIGLLREIGIDVQRFYKYFDQKLYSSMQMHSAMQFDKETFGEDRLVIGSRGGWGPSPFLTPECVAQMPIADAARKDLLRLHDSAVDYLPDLSPDQKRVKLLKTSYKDFLLNDAKAHPDVVKIFQQAPHDLYAVGIDAVSAENCRGMGFPGFKGMQIAENRHRSGEEEPYIFHFPDGNASIARLLVRSLIPGSIPGNTMEDVVTAKADYTRLDDSGNGVRIRLNSTGVRARHLGDPGSAKEVEVTYVNSGNAYRVRGAACVMACYNCIVPYMCPEMPEKQRAGLAYAVKLPLVYTNVQLRNWESFYKLRASHIYAPAGYFCTMTLDFPVSIGDYKFPSSPEQACVIHLTRTPCKPGLPCKDQYRAGRWDLYTTPFKEFESKINDQLGRALGGGGFDPSRDIQAITVNRWPHGYAYEYNPLFEPVDRPDAERPCVIGRQPFGRITIANSDSDGHAYTNIAIDQAYRAVTELFGHSASGDMASVEASRAV